MRKILLVLLVVCMGVSFVVAQDETPEPSLPYQTPVAMETAELFKWIQSIDPVLEAHSVNWYLSGVSNNATNTGLTWIEACCLGLFTVEEIRFCCEENMATSFSYEQNMMPYYQIVLANYIPFEVLEFCEVDGIRIHEFKGTWDGHPYYIRHFHEVDGLTVTSTGLYFRRQHALEQYSQLFFPDISCPAEPAYGLPQEPH